uniref:Uncharacterized protein n=1 Tax=Glossina pallidipes TaxID=7398 RepID=A0A1A9Z299_GLOPL
MVQVTLKLLTKPFDIKSKQLFHMFYIEPILFVLVFPHSLSGIIIKNEIIYQTCIVMYQYNESDCIKLGTRNVTGYLQNCLNGDYMKKPVKILTTTMQEDPESEPPYIQLYHMCGVCVYINICTIRDIESKF